MSNNYVKCGECVFFFLTTKYHNKGECRKNPPSMNDKGYGCWPLLSKEEGCFSGDPIKKGLLTESEVKIMGDKTI